jgi:hypothetical protein
VPGAAFERLNDLGVGLDLAHDVARDPAEISADRLQRPVGALETLGVGIPLMGDQRMFADPLVGLAQPDAGSSSPASPGARGLDA